MAPEAAERLNKRLAYAMDADRSGWDLTQLLRPPGARNHKYPDAPEAALREMTGEVHDPEELDRMLPEAPGGEDKRLTEPKSPPIPDDEVIALCRKAGNAEKFSALFDDGDVKRYHGGDDSAADAALLAMMSFYTQDEHQLDRLFRRSALIRPKWDREDYRELTFSYVLTEDRAYYGAEREYPAVELVNDDGDELGSDTNDGVTLSQDGGPSPTRGAVPPFPVHALSPTLERFVLEAAHAKECPSDLVALPVLAALGAAIGASRRVEIARTYHEPPNIWTAVVAPPASGKSPAEDAALLPMLAQQRVYNHQHELALEEYEEKHRAWEQVANEARKKKRRIPPEPEKPVKKRIRVGDTTLEALMLRLVQNPRGLILTRDELAGFFNSLDQYRQKGADREVWLSLHSGKAPPLDRKSADESHDLDYPTVSMCGGIQPGKLKVLDIGAGDGMVERFLFAWPEATLFPDAERDISVEAEDGYRKVWDRLHALEMGQDNFGKPAPKNVPLTPGAQAAWTKHRRLLKESAYKPGVPEFMQGVLGKMRGYLAHFSLILALVRVAEGEEGLPEEVRREDVERAAELVRYFVAHAYRVYSELEGESRETHLAYALGDLLTESGGEWKGSATELFNTLKDIGHGGALPKVPDSLTEEVLKVVRKTPALRADKGRTGKRGRYLHLWWAPRAGGGPSPGDGVTRHQRHPGGEPGELITRHSHDAA